MSACRSMWMMPMRFDVTDAMPRTVGKPIEWSPPRMRNEPLAATCATAFEIWSNVFSMLAGMVKTSPASHSVICSRRRSMPRLVVVRRVQRGDAPDALRAEARARAVRRPAVERHAHHGRVELAARSTSSRYGAFMNVLISREVRQLAARERRDVAVLDRQRGRQPELEPALDLGPTCFAGISPSFTADRQPFVDGFSGSPARARRRAAARDGQPRQPTGTSWWWRSRCSFNSSGFGSPPMRFLFFWILRGGDGGPRLDVSRRPPRPKSLRRRPHPRAAGPPLGPRQEGGDRARGLRASHMSLAVFMAWTAIEDYMHLRWASTTSGTFFIATYVLFFAALLFSFETLLIRPCRPSTACTAPTLGSCTDRSTARRASSSRSSSSGSRPGTATSGASCAARCSSRTASCTACARWRGRTTAESPRRARRTPTEPAYAPGSSGQPAWSNV